MIHQELISRTNLVGDIYGNHLMTTKRRLTAAEIRAIYDTPIELIPSPGADKYIWVAKITAYLEYATAVFTGTGDLIFTETDGSGTEVATELPYATLNSAADVISDISNVDAAARLLDTPIVVSAETANPGGATAASILTLTILYMITKPG